MNILGLFAGLSMRQADNNEDHTSRIHLAAQIRDGETCMAPTLDMNQGKIDTACQGRQSLYPCSSRFLPAVEAQLASKGHKAFSLT